MKTLISMTDFVLYAHKKSITPLKDIVEYASFIKQPLELWMFVPCKLVDGVCEVLEEPDQLNYNMNLMPIENKYFDDLQEYQQAKERCLFDGFDYYDEEDNFIYVKCFINEIKSQLVFDKETKDIFIDNNFFNKYLHTIEDLTKYNLELTTTSLKQIGL